MRLLLLLLLLNFACSQADNSVATTKHQISKHPKLLIHEVDLNSSELNFYYKNESLENYANHKRLKESLKKKNQILNFAVNGGMYKKDFSPQGLYIENGEVINDIDLQQEGYGNFFLQPNGIFYVNKDNTAGIVPSTRFKHDDAIRYATQSGPMLIIDGEIHPALRDGSTNLHIRNGVGILPNGNLLFAMSKEKINFYELATYFSNNGCNNALYLDGFVSRTYLPSENWVQEDGHFGVIIGEIKRN